jgi:hypothetical protein
VLRVGIDPSHGEPVVSTGRSSGRRPSGTGSSGKGASGKSASGKGSSGKGSSGKAGASRANAPHGPRAPGRSSGGRPPARQQGGSAGAAKGLGGRQVDKPHEISESDVAAVVSDYTSGDYSDGVGLVFVVENFNKLKQEATVWVAFFDISTHELIQTKRFSAGPRGFGFRNYWAGAIYSVIEQIREDYKAWAKKAK